MELMIQQSQEDGMLALEDTLISYGNPKHIGILCLVPTEALDDQGRDKAIACMLGGTA